VVEAKLLLVLKQQADGGCLPFGLFMFLAQRSNQQSGLQPRMHPHCVLGKKRTCAADLTPVTATARTK
jgi:hypothetical protein